MPGTTGGPGAQEEGMQEAEKGMFTPEMSALGRAGRLSMGER